jgi:hypothetical protein
MRTPAQWLQRMKRRKPGVYAYRTDRNLRPGREWGYVGKARDLDVRDRCHNGRCHHATGCAPKPWLDLRPKRYSIELPWWLGFDFITLSLETLVILVLRPRYNWQKNPRAGKVGPRTQAVQRAERDALRALGEGHTETWSAPGVAVGRALQVLGAAVVLVGLVGWLVTR